MKNILLKTTLLLLLLTGHNAVYSQKKKFLRNEFSIHTGYGKMVDITSGLTLSSPDYTRSLSNGLNWQGQYYFHLIRHVAIGLMYNGFWSKANHAEGGDQLFIHYLAPQIGIYIVNNERWKTRLAIGVGQIFYRDNSQVFGKPRRVVEKTTGGHGSLNTIYKWTKHWGVGMEIQYMYGQLDEINPLYHDETIFVRFKDDNKLNLSRLNLSIGLSYDF